MFLYFLEANLLFVVNTLHLSFLDRILIHGYLLICLLQKMCIRDRTNTDKYGKVTVHYYIQNVDGTKIKNTAYINQKGEDKKVPEEPEHTYVEPKEEQHISKNGTATIENLNSEITYNLSLIHI